MNLINKIIKIKVSFFMIVLTTLKVNGQIVPVGKYNITDYPKDRKIINLISNIFDKSLSLNDNLVSIGADGTISYGVNEELQKFVKNGLAFKSVTSIPGTELLRIFNGTTAIKTKVAEVVFSSPNGEVHFKVIRAETYIKHKGKWYFVLGQGTNCMTENEFDQYKKLHTVK